MKTKTTKRSYRSLETTVATLSAASADKQQHISELLDTQAQLVAQRDSLLNAVNYATRLINTSEERLRQRRHENVQLQAFAQRLSERNNELFKHLESVNGQCTELQAKNDRLRKYIDVLITSLGTAQGQPIAA